MSAALHVITSEADDVTEPDPVRVDDLADDPRTDVEALCLCALMWSPPAAAAAITAHLRADDFHRPVYADLYARIAVAITVGRPHEPAMILADMTRTAATAGHRGQLLARALTDVTLAGSTPEAVADYTLAVLGAAYRRHFHTAAAAMTHAAEQLPQDQLYEHLKTIGWSAKAATERLHHATAALAAGPGCR